MVDCISGQQVQTFIIETMKTKFLLLIIFMPLFVIAQTQIGFDIDGEAAYDNSGYALSLSGNGNTVAVGAYTNDGNGNESGHTRIYQNIGGSWTQIGEDIDGEDKGDTSGRSVSLNFNGSIVAIGATGNNGNNGDYSGHVRIYRNIGGSWIQMGTDIDGEALLDNSGHSVSLNSDGSKVAIGAKNNNDSGSRAGHVRVFDLSSVLNIDKNLLLDFSVYPSPTSGFINITSENTITQIEVYNQLEQLVASNKDQKTIDISSASQGIYFIRIKDIDGNMGTQKVLKN
ncbi:MAG: hypothetical protein ACJA2S_004840 [Cyclobacteriaceae bacterium]|jgi:hypothetical protein